MSKNRELSQRAENFIRGLFTVNGPLETIHPIVSAEIRSGRLRLKYWPGIGKVTAKEIQAWAGVSDAEMPSREVLRRWDAIDAGIRARRSAATARVVEAESWCKGENVQGRMPDEIFVIVREALRHCKNSPDLFDQWTGSQYSD